MHTAVFSIVSPNYWHYARVLMASVRQHHPEWDRFVLVVGETPAAKSDDEPFTTVPLEALPLPNPLQFRFRYTLLELNTAVKPWMFELLFGRGYDRVVYLDPDIYVYSPLAELESLPPETFLALTPHLTGFIEGDDHPSERTILQAGVYNLGFLAVSRRPALPRFLAWWQEKLELQCVVDVARGLFVDQKWMDLTPGLFPDVAILRHEGYNVAYWNLGQRTVAEVNGSATVNGQPLRFFHFSGLDPASPATVSRHNYRLKTRDVGDAGKLVEDYLVALHEAGFESFRDSPYAFGAFADGTSVPNVARIAYRNSTSLQSACGPDPFAHPELFQGISDPAPPRLAARVGVASYRLLSRARPLVRLIPRSMRTAMREFLLRRRDPSPRPLRIETALQPGINVVGYIERETGVGESARLCRRACIAAGLASHLIDVDRPDPGNLEAVHPASVYHVNADQILAIQERIPQVFEASSYNIGCWHWELPELPDEWVASAEPLDEIWASSSFIQSAISRKTTVPVVHMPHGIEITSIEACTPQELGVPAGRFTFLCMFDLDSVVDRKNPLGAVEAFQRAFPRDSSVALLIKAGRGVSHPEQYAQLQERIQGNPNVYLTNRALSRARAYGLIAACDALVSLHRSEGFGLILAESMYLGKPVVATGWSGNMDFMHTGNSCPVGFELVTLDRSYGYYQAGQQWAEPDTGHAAHLMRRVVEDAEYRARIGERARATIRSRFSPEAAGLRYRRRLEFLGLVGGVNGD
jgi:glycosyltransferase involved in cell wall biosynthesis